MKASRLTPLLLVALVGFSIFIVAFSGPTANAVLGSCPATGQLASDSQRIPALGQWNTYRLLANAGLSGTQIPSVVEDGSFTYSKQAQTHAGFVYVNSDNSGISPLTEGPSDPCYSTEGSTGAAKGITRPGLPWLGTTNNVSDLRGGVEALFNSIYDRLFMLNPRLGQVGLGISNPGSNDAKFVVDVTSGITSTVLTFSPIVFPARNMQNVPTTMAAGEYPEPLSALGKTYPVGYPIHVIFDPSLSGINITGVTVSSSGGTTGVIFIQPKSSTYPQKVKNANLDNAVTIIPNSPLSPFTTYTVSVTGNFTGSPLTWSFTTGSTGTGTTTTTTTTGVTTTSGILQPPVLIPTQTPIATPTPTPGIPAFPQPVQMPPAPVGGGFFEMVYSDATNALFFQQWRRVDDPVLYGKAFRSWIYGERGHGFALLLEPYNGQLRIVNYHDKARMEAANADATSISNGLLVREMVSGFAQVGDSAFIPRVPALVAIAGDVIETNINAPTYYSFYNIASLNNDRRAPNQTGQTVIATISNNGVINVNPGSAGYNVINVYYDNNLGHNIPNVFWSYMNQSGIVNVNGSYFNATVTDWLSTYGLPITEAYWTRVFVGGVEKDVLVQLFERRVLTFTPSNPDPFKVEMGNVGRHYFKWRYNVNY
jgi:hypothetical protein